jgi:hypothetical protein
VGRYNVHEHGEIRSIRASALRRLLQVNHMRSQHSSTIQSVIWLKATMLLFASNYSVDAALSSRDITLEIEDRREKHRNVRGYDERTVSFPFVDPMPPLERPM